MTTGRQGGLGFVSSAQVPGPHTLSCFCIFWHTASRPRATLEEDTVPCEVSRGEWAVNSLAASHQS